MEVDETKIGKRKSQWLFGLVERETGELRLELTVPPEQEGFCHPDWAHEEACWAMHNDNKRLLEGVYKVGGGGERISRRGVNVKKDLAGLHFAEFLWFKKYHENAFDNMVKHISDIY